MVLRFFRGDGDDRLAQVETRLTAMLVDDRHSFDIATSALIGGADASTVGSDLRRTDRRVNEGEREIRRDLVVHASVHGAIDTPAILMYMSVVKDVERIGDYAKNVFDLAAEGVDLSSAPDLGDLQRVRERISRLISETATAFAERDEDQARALIAEGDTMLDRFDELVAGYLHAEQPGRDAVPRALFYRHCKRIVAHLMNVLSAVVMPLDQLDYLDEDRETRG